LHPDSLKGRRVALCVESLLPSPIVNRLHLGVKKREVFESKSTQRHQSQICLAVFRGSQALCHPPGLPLLQDP